MTEQVSWGLNDKPVTWGLNDKPNKPLLPPDTNIEASDEFQSRIRIPDEQTIPAQPHPYTAEIERFRGVDNAPDGTLPSPERMAEALPAGLATILGVGSGFNPLAAGLGGYIGEAMRDTTREKYGYPAGTGFLQEQLGLEPGSAEAILSGLVGETAMGAGGEAAMNWISKIIPGLKHSARREFAKTLRPDAEGSGKYTIEKLAEIIEPVEKNLPVGTRGRMTRQAAEEAQAAGQRVRGIYDSSTPVPEGFDRAINRLEDRAKSVGEIRTPEHQTFDVDPITGRVDTERIAPDIVDEKSFRSYLNRANRLKEAAAKRKSFDISTTGTEKPFSSHDVWRQRKQADIESLAFKKDAPGLTRAELLQTPELAALQDERQALRETLHEAIPEGKMADSVYHAYQTILERVPKEDASTFLQRWIAGKTVPGPAGTIIGTIAARPASARSLLSKTGMKIASALERGDHNKAMRLFQMMLDDTSGDPKPLVSHEEM